MGSPKDLFGNTIYVDFFNLALGITGGDVEAITVSVRTTKGAYADLKLTKEDVIVLKQHLEPKIIKEKENAIDIINRVYNIINK